MTVINHKSISGITSITAPAGSDNLFTVHTNDTTERFRIDASGHQNISGIITAANFKTGTSNLHNTGLNIQDLDVDGHTNLDNVNILGVTTAIGNFNVTGASYLYGNGGAAVVWGNTGYSGHLTFDGSDNAVIRAASGKALIIQTNHVNERLRITSAGKVGINSTTPADLLTIGAGANTLAFGAKDTTRGNHIWQLLNNDGSGNAEFRLYKNSVSGTHAQSINFATSGDANYILDGKLGVGIAAPTAKLEVLNNSNIEVLRLKDTHFNKYLTIRGGGSPNRMVIDSYEGGGGGADIDFASNGSTKLRITSEGKFSLGDSIHASPGAVFHIDWDSNNLLMLDNNSASTQKMFFASQGATHAQIYGTTSSGAFTIESDPSNNHSSSLINFKVDGNERVRITSGNVLAINKTDAPTWYSSIWSAANGGGGALHVGGATVLYEDSYSSGNDNYSIWGNNVYLGTGSANLYLKNDAASRIYQHDGNFWFQNAAAGTAGNAITFVTPLKITSSGDVGIGQDTPTERFHIKQDDAIGPSITLEHNSSSHKCWINNWGSSGGGSGRQNKFEINATTVNSLALASAYISLQAGGAGDSFERVRITTTALLPGTDNNLDLGSSSKRWANIYTGDLQLSNVTPSVSANGEDLTASGNEVDDTQGTWTIQEGLNDLFLINRINGKKYKFNLTEVS